MGRSKGYVIQGRLIQDFRLFTKTTLNKTRRWEHIKLSHNTLEELEWPLCVCETKCSCGSIKTIKDQRDAKYGLNDDFRTTRAQILLMEPLPPINWVFSLLLQHERHINIENLTMSKVLFNFSNGRSAPNKNDTTQQWKPRFPGQR
ncbi:hypothetical protein Lal_00001350 [Lupinus albus]|nr:hypothetical protein Lal_00001350 [Lupinus albus]